MLTRDQILTAAPTLPVEEVEVPEWGGTVRVQGLSADDADAFLAASVSRGRAANQPGEFNRRQFQSRLCVLCLVDEQGHRLFTEKDIAVLGAKSATSIARIALVAMRLSGLNPGDVEELKGN